MIDAETGLPYAYPDAPTTGTSTNPAASNALPAAQPGQPSGGISPLLLALMQQQGGPGMDQLLQYFLGGGGGAAQPAPVPGVGNPVQAPSGPPPDPLTPQQRAFMGYGGQGQPPNWAAAMGMYDPTGGWSPQYQAPSGQQNYTPQDFVSQWNQLYGRS